MKISLAGAVCGAILLLTAVPGVFAQQEAEQKTPDPYSKLDATWISIDGQVESVSADSFVLNYGKGQITVEMDDGDRDADGYKLVKGDKVRVNGRIDNDFFERTTIEASSVYVENLGTYFFASSVDEEDYVAYTYTAPIVISTTIIRGKVTAVNDDEFVVDTGLRQVRVELDELGYNPLDDEGYQKIEVGDRVSVSGKMDSDFFEAQRELVADSVINLSS